MKKLVKENVSDVLKPKNLVGKLLCRVSSTTGRVEFICRIEEITNPEEYEDNVICEVVYNNHMIEGPDFYGLDEGDLFNISQEDLQYYEFTELSQKEVEALQRQIDDLEELKKYLQKLLNES